METITTELVNAIAHVLNSHPSLAIVIFDNEGRWQYMDENFEAFVFGDEIDVNILQDAADSIESLPFIHQIN